MPDSSRERLAYVLLAVGVVAFAVLHTVLAHWKSQGLMSEWGFDLTFFHNLVWNFSEGHGYRQSATYHEPPGIFAETHFEPIILLAVPFYKVVPSLTTLFAVQATLIALGSIGVFRLVRSGGGTALAAVAGAWLYLGWWPVWRVTMADIRPLTWALPLLLLCCAALREGKHREAFAWGLAACFSREEIPLLVIGLCAAAWLWRLEPRGRRRTTAVLLAVASVVFLVGTTMMRSNSTFYIRPMDWIRTMLGGENPDGAMAQWGHSAGELLGTRVRFLAEWFVPVGIGAVLAPELIAASAPMLVYLFSQAHEWATWEGPYIHHSAPAMGLIAAAAAVGWTRLLTRLPVERVSQMCEDRATRLRIAVLSQPRPSFVVWLMDRTGQLDWRSVCRGASVIAVLIGLFAAEVLVLRGIRINQEDVVYSRWERHVEGEIEPWRQQDERVLEAHRLADQVPADAVVMADWHTVHLFSGRLYVYSYHQESPDEISPGVGEPMLAKAEEQPRWALINTEDQPWMARAEAHGLIPRDRGGDWVLYGPK